MYNKYKKNTKTSLHRTFIFHPKQERIPISVNDASLARYYLICLHYYIFFAFPKEGFVEQVGTIEGTVEDMN